MEDFIKNDTHCQNMAFFGANSLIIDNSFELLTMLWNLLGHLMQTSWDFMIQAFGVSQSSLHLLGSIFLPLFLHWILALLFLYVDLTGRPKWILKYKVQDQKASYPVDKQRMKAVIKQVIFNHLFVQIPGVTLHTLLRESRGYDSSRTLPTFNRFVVDFIVFFVCLEIFSYYIHRILHYPLVYKHFHKRHHEWQAPYAWTSSYCHPVEHIFNNMVPAGVGPLLMGSHLFTYFSWLILIMVSSISIHCGYHLPFMTSPESHDYHHLKFNQNFGLLGILDRIHGTDANFRKTKAFKRHVWLLSLVSLKEQIPDDDSKQ